MTYFLFRDYSILPKKELPLSPWVNSTPQSDPLRDPRYLLTLKWYCISTPSLPQISRHGRCFPMPSIRGQREFPTALEDRYPRGPMLSTSTEPGLKKMMKAATRGPRPAVFWKPLGFWVYAPFVCRITQTSPNFREAPTPPLLVGC